MFSMEHSDNSKPTMSADRGHSRLQIADDVISDSCGRDRAEARKRVSKSSRVFVKLTTPKNKPKSTTFSPTLATPPQPSARAPFTRPCRKRLCLLRPIPNPTQLHQHGPNSSIPPKPHPKHRALVMQSRPAHADSHRRPARPP